MAESATTPASSAPVEKESGNLRLARWLGYFALADLLFFPYFQALIMPYSLPLLVLAFLFLDVKIRRDRYLYAVIVLGAAMLISTAVYHFVPSRLIYQMENIKRVIQLLSSFLYFFYFRWLATRTRFRVVPILLIFVIWYSGLATWFAFDAMGTAEFLHNIYGRLVKLALDYRFAYLFTDPNTAIYFFLVALGPVMMATRSAVPYLLLVVVMMIQVLLSQSRGGMIAAGFIVMLGVFPLHLFPNVGFSRKRVLVLLGILCFLAVVVQQWNFLVKENLAIRVASDRLFTNESAYLNGNGRDYHWGRITTLLPLPLGRGYTLINFGEVLPPHSDLWRMIYAYGLVALIPAVIFFFGRLGSWSPLVFPALIAFLINSLIDEQKLLGLYLALLGVAVAGDAADRESVETVKRVTSVPAAEE